MATHQFRAVYQFVSTKYMCISVVGCGAVTCLRSYICMPQIWSDSHSIECGGRSVVWWSLAQVKF